MVIQYRCGWCWRSDPRSKNLGPANWGGGGGRWRRQLHHSRHRVAYPASLVFLFPTALGVFDQGQALSCTHQLLTRLKVAQIKSRPSSSPSWPSLHRNRGTIVSPEKSAKVLQTLRFRPLWRSGRLAIHHDIQRPVWSGALTRNLSSRSQNAGEASTDDKALVSGRVHILGTGNAGIFMSQTLAKRQSPPKVTLFMVNWGMYEAYRQRKKKLSINYDGLTDGLKRGVDVEVLSGNKWYAIPQKYGEKFEDNGQRISQESEKAELQRTKEPIDCLIVSCKANHAFTGIRSLASRLSPESTIMITQNGLGIVERLNKFIFTNPKRRPKYLHAVFSHGLDKKDMYQVKYKTVGTINIAPPARGYEISLVDPEDDKSWLPSTKYLIRLFTLTPALVATANTPTNVLMYQLEKLAVACIIDPLTALNDCRNGELLYLESVSRIMRLLLFEISRVIVALPELQGVPGLEERFQPERLRRMVVSQLDRTRSNTSTMLHDVKGRKGTEIEFLNGYIVRRGEELGITCVINYLVKHMIHAKQNVNNRQESEAIPIDSYYLPTDTHYLTGRHRHSLPKAGGPDSPRETIKAAFDSEHSESAPSLPQKPLDLARN